MKLPNWNSDDDKNKVLIMLGSIIVLCVILLIVIFLNNKSNSNLNPDAKISPSNVKSVGVPTKSTALDGDDNGPLTPFDKTNSPTVLVDDIQFNQPVALPSATVKNSGPQILQATDKYLLIKTYDDTFYLYDNNTKRRKVIDSNVRTGIITSDYKYLIYEKDDGLFRNILYYSIDTGMYRGSLITLPNYSVTTKLLYSNGALYYSYYNEQDSTKAITDGLLILPSETAMFTGKEQMKVGSNSVTATISNNLYYYYDATANSIEQVQLTGQPLPIGTPAKAVTNPIGLTFSPKNNWALYSTNTLVTSSGEIPDYKTILFAQWFDDSHLLVNDNGQIYLYNITTKKSTLLISQAATHFGVLTGDKIYYEDPIGNVYYIQKKK